MSHTVYENVTLDKNKFCFKKALDKKMEMLV